MVYTDDNTPKIIWTELDPVYSEINKQLCGLLKAFEKCLSSELTASMKLELDQIKKSISDVYGELADFEKANKDFIQQVNKWDPECQSLLRQRDELVNFIGPDGKNNTLCFDEDDDEEELFTFVKDGKKEYACPKDLVSVYDLPKFVKVPILPAKMDKYYESSGSTDHARVHLDLESLASSWGKSGVWEICTDYF